MQKSSINSADTQDAMKKINKLMGIAGKDDDEE